MAITAAELQVVLKARDEASRVIQDVERNLGSLGRAGNSLGGSFLNLGSSVLGVVGTLGKVAAVAGGAGVAAFGALAYSALGATAEYERMGLAFETLTAKELARGKVVTETRNVVAQMTASERKEVEGLNEKITAMTLARATDAAQIQEQRQRVIELTAANGESALNVQTARAKLAEMESQYRNSGREIEAMRKQVTDLTGKQGKLVTVTEQVRKGEMSMSEALKQASPIAKDLLAWTQKLAIMSPFDQASVAATYKQAMAYGFLSNNIYGLSAGTQGVIQAQQQNIMTAERLTQSILDYAAGAGLTTETMSRMGLALGQIQAMGKLSGQEVRQLTEAGIGVDTILSRAFGKSTAEIVRMREAGLIPADQAIMAIVGSLEEDFGGAAARQTNTISGMVNSLQDIKNIALREFFQSTFDAIKTNVNDFVSLMANDPVRAMQPLRDLGQTLGDSIGAVLGKARVLMAVLGTGGGLLGILSAFNVPIEVRRGILELASNLGGLAATIVGAVGAAVTWFSDTALPNLQTVLTLVNDNWDLFEGALAGIGALLASAAIASAIMGIVGAVAALATGIGPIIALAAILGIAWNKNWFGIRDTMIEVWTKTIQPTLADISTALGNLKSVADQQGIAAALIVALAYGWSQAQRLMAAWSTDFWNWLTGENGALASAGSNLDQIGVRINEWSQSENTKKNINSAGFSIGAFLSSAVSQEIERRVTDFETASKFITESFANGAASRWGGTVVKMAIDLKMAFEQFSGRLAETGYELLKGIWSGLMTFDLGPRAHAWLEKAKESIKDEIKNVDLASIGVDIAQGILSGLMPALGPFSSVVGPAIENQLRTGVDAKSPARSMIPLGQDIVGGMMVGIGQAVYNLQNAGQDMVAAIDWGVHVGAEDMPGKFQALADQWLVGLSNMRYQDTAQTAVDGILKQWMNVALPNTGSAPHKAVEKLLRMQLDTTDWQLGETAGQYGSRVIDAVIAAWGDAGNDTQKSLKRARGGLATMLGEFNNQVLSDLDAFNPLSGQQLMSLAGSLSGLGSTAAGLMRSRLVDPAKEHVQYLQEQLDLMKKQNVALDAQQIVTNQIMAEKGIIAGYEQSITNLQKQQENLSFLQSQVQLLTTIRENGLSAADVLGGLKLGLDADLPSVVDAMARAMQMIIERAQAELGIASPSRKFLEIGRQMMTGMAQGVMRFAGLPTSAVAGVAGSVTNVTNNLNLSTTREAGNIAGEFRMMQLLGAYA